MFLKLSISSTGADAPPLGILEKMPPPLGIRPPADPKGPSLNYFEITFLAD